MKFLHSILLLRAGAWLLAVCLAGTLGGRGAHAQTLNYAPAGATSAAGAYADLGAAGAAISVFSADDANSAPQNIGFAFDYNSQTFTQFVLNTNGFVRLGAAPPSEGLYLPEDGGLNVDPFQGLRPADVNFLVPFGFDLTNGTGPGGAEFRVATTGAAPGRVCTIQWKNVTDKGRIAPAQYASFSFQIKLYETTNVVEFVYDAPTASATPATLRRAVVGLKGSGWASGQVVQVTKSATAAWSAPAFTGTAVGSTPNTLNFTNAAPPDAGRTYRFVPTTLPATDVEVRAIYTLGKVAGAVAPPVAVQAVVRNNGRAALANVPVTLAVGSATPFTNTQTLAALPVGTSTTVTFAAYSVAGTSGVNTLTVSVPADDVNTNNTQTFTQTITANELSYSSGAPLVNSIGVGGVSNSAFAVRYQTNGPAILTAVTPTFVGANAAGTTPAYVVRVYTVGTDGGPSSAPVYTSAPRPRPAQGGPDVVPVPNLAVNGGFFATVQTTTPYSLGLGYETETPLRPGTFYYLVITTNFTWTDLRTQTSLNPRLALDVTVARTGLGTRTRLGQGELTAYPNPAHSAVTVAIPAVAGARTATLTLLNSLGQTVQTSHVALLATGTAVPLPLTGLAAGLYTVRVQAGNETVALRVAVE